MRHEHPYRNAQVLGYFYDNAMKKTSSTGIEIEVIGTSRGDPVAQSIFAAQQAVRAALREHKLAGNSIAVWREGKVVLVPPEQIEA